MSHNWKLCSVELVVLLLTLVAHYQPCTQNVLRMFQTPNQYVSHHQIEGNQPQTTEFAPLQPSILSELPVILGISWPGRVWWCPQQLKIRYFSCREISLKSPPRISKQIAVSMGKHRKYTMLWSGRCVAQTSIKMVKVKTIQNLSKSFCPVFAMESNCQNSALEVMYQQ